MAAIGWYGPLIDLSDAASHVGDFVQLVVFVHRSTPIQYKLSKGGAPVRTDIRVGDDTRPFFSISLWQKQIGSMALVGDVILLQNVKITRFGDVVEARTVYCSSLLSLVHPYESIITKGVDNLLNDSRAGVTTKEKLRKVIEWVQKAGSTFCSAEFRCCQKRQLKRNWKAHEEQKPQDFLSPFQVSNLTHSCKGTFYASVGEIFLPITWRKLAESEEEMMFISRRIHDIGYNNLVEDLICTGCELCSSPLDSGYEPICKLNSIPLCCCSSSDHVHKISSIYRPFMLYVWDEMDYIPILVKNKAAELLFGSIKAEKVYLSCKEQKRHSPCNVHMKNHPHARTREDVKAAEEKVTSSFAEDGDKKLCCRELNFCQIWLIMLKMLLQHGTNSPLKFEVKVNPRLDKERGRFELVSVSMPCFRPK